MNGFCDKCKEERWIFRAENRPDGILWICNECDSLEPKVKTFERRWISVKEKLPSHKEEIFFTFEDGANNSPSAWYKYPCTLHRGDYWIESQYRQYFRDDCHEVNSEKVSHWMPIPPSPFED